MAEFGMDNRAICGITSLFCPSGVLVWRSMKMTVKIYKNVEPSAGHS